MQVRAQGADVRASKDQDVAEYRTRRLACYESELSTLLSAGADIGAVRELPLEDWRAAMTQEFNTYVRQQRDAYARDFPGNAPVGLQERVRGVVTGTLLAGWTLLTAPVYAVAGLALVFRDGESGEDRISSESPVLRDHVELSAAGAFIGAIVGAAAGHELGDGVLGSYLGCVAGAGIANIGVGFLYARERREERKGPGYQDFSENVQPRLWRLHDSILAD